MCSFNVFILIPIIVKLQVALVTWRFFLPMLLLFVHCKLVSVEECLLALATLSLWWILGVNFSNVSLQVIFVQECFTANAADWISFFFVCIVFSILMFLMFNLVWKYFDTYRASSLFISWRHDFNLVLGCVAGQVQWFQYQNQNQVFFCFSFVLKFSFKLLRELVLFRR